MTHSFPIDPELRLLLQDIADDPKSRLFTPIPRPTRLTLSRPDPIGPAAVGLTSAERQLVRVYREETAQALRDAAVWKLRQDPLGAAQVSAYRDPVQSWMIQDRESVLGLFQSRIAQRAERFDDEALRREIRSAQAMLVSPSTAAAQFAALSLRLLGHDAGWILMARAFLLEKELASALRSLAPVARCPLSPAMRASALSWIGVTFGLAQSSPNALVAYTAAAQVPDPAPIILFSWLYEALSVGDVETALRAAEQIEAYVPVDAPSLDEWAQKLAVRRILEPASTATSPADRNAKRLADRVGPTARRVIHAIS